MDRLGELVFPTIACPSTGNDNFTEDKAVHDSPARDQARYTRYAFQDRAVNVPIWHHAYSIQVCVDIKATFSIGGQRAS